MKEAGKMVRQYLPVSVMRLKDRIYQWIDFNGRRRSIQRDGLVTIGNISNILISKGAKVFLDYGSLLGIARDHRLIAWDDDIDFGIFIDEAFSWENLESTMEEQGYRKTHQFRFRDEITEQSYSFGRIHIDFFRHFETNGKSISYVYDRKNDKRYPSINAWDVMEFKTPAITGITIEKIDKLKYPFPGEAEIYLASVYGENWRIPDPSWKTGSGPATKKIGNEYGYIETVE